MHTRQLPAGGAIKTPHEYEAAEEEDEEEELNRRSRSIANQEQEHQPEQQRWSRGKVQE